MTKRFEELVEKYHYLVLHLIRKYYQGRFQHDAEDIAQDVWSKIWVQLKKNESEIEHVKSYLYRTVQTTLWDAVQKLKRDPLAFGVEEVDEVPATASKSSGDIESRVVARNQLDTMLAKLKPEERLMVRAHLEGLNYQEIATLMNSSEGRVRNLLSRIKKRMTRNFHALDTRKNE